MYVPSLRQQLAEQATKPPPGLMQSTMRAPRLCARHGAADSIGLFVWTHDHHFAFRHSIPLGEPIAPQSPTSRCHRVSGSLWQSLNTTERNASFLSTSTLQTMASDEVLLRWEFPPASEGRDMRTFNVHATAQGSSRSTHLYKVIDGSCRPETPVEPLFSM